MDVKRTVISQGVKPTGNLGRIMAWAYLAMFTLFRSQYEQIARLLDLGPQDEVLDVACGSGAFLEKYASQVGRIAGLDHSDVQIGMALRRHRSRIEAGTAEILQGDSARLPWRDGTFTAVTCNCLGCFAEPTRSLGEMQRVLRPGGRAVLAFDYRPDEQNARRSARKYGLTFWSEREVRALMNDAGFSQVAISRDKATMFVRGSKPAPGFPGAGLLPVSSRT